MHQRILASKRLPGLSRGVVCVILRLAILIQCRRVTHTDGHWMMAITRAGKKLADASAATADASADLWLFITTYGPYTL